MESLLSATHIVGIQYLIFCWLFCLEWRADLLDGEVKQILALGPNPPTTHSFNFLKFILLILLEKKDINLLLHLFMYSLIDSCMCPDWGLNPQPWSMSVTEQIGLCCPPPIGKFQRQRFGEKEKGSFIQNLHNFGRMAGFCLRFHPLQNTQRKTPPPSARQTQSCTQSSFSHLKTLSFGKLQAATAQSC